MLQKGLSIFFLLIVCCLPLFLHLDSLPIQLFDESRLAVNATEMAENGGFIVTRFEGEPDLWNTKPPLMIWLQVLCLKIVGYNELAIRLPAALSALATVFFIGFFCWKKMDNPVWGIASMGVLVTTPGFVSNHVSRTGDYDSLLVFMTVLFLFSFFQFVHAKQKRDKNRFLYFSALFLALAVLTKGIAGLLFVPAAVIYLFLKKQGFKALKSKDTYFAMTLFLVLVFSYYFLREHYNPGYLKAVWENELGGRYFETIENHKKPFYFHLKYLWKVRFVPWLYFLPIGLVVGFYEKGFARNFIQFLFIAALSYLVIISFSSTKLMWYDAPMFPLLAVITAFGIERVSFVLNKNYNVNQSLLIILLFALPYFNIVRSVYFTRDQNPKQHQYGLFMRKFDGYKNYSVVKKGYNAHLQFYINAFNHKGSELNRIEPQEIKAGETLLFCGKGLIKSLNKQFNYEILEDGWGCILVKIGKKKD